MRKMLSGMSGLVSRRRGAPAEAGSAVDASPDPASIPDESAHRFDTVFPPADPALDEAPGEGEQAADPIPAAPLRPGFLARLRRRGKAAPAETPEAVAERPAEDAFVSADPEVDPFAPPEPAEADGAIPAKPSRFGRLLRRRKVPPPASDGVSLADPPTELPALPSPPEGAAADAEASRGEPEVPAPRGSRFAKFLPRRRRAAAIPESGGGEGVVASAVPDVADTGIAAADAPPPVARGRMSRLAGRLRRRPRDVVAPSADALPLPAPGAEPLSEARSESLPETLPGAVAEVDRPARPAPAESGVPERIRIDLAIVALGLPGRPGVQLVFQHLETGARSTERHETALYPSEVQPGDYLLDVSGHALRFGPPGRTEAHVLVPVRTRKGTPSAMPANALGNVLVPFDTRLIDRIDRETGVCKTHLRRAPVVGLAFREIALEAKTKLPSATDAEIVTPHGDGIPSVAEVGKVSPPAVVASPAGGDVARDGRDSVQAAVGEAAGDLRRAVVG